MDTAFYRANKRGQRDWYEQEEQLNGFMIKQIDYNSHKTIKLRDINLNINKCYKYYAYNTF